MKKTEQAEMVTKEKMSQIIAYAGECGIALGFGFSSIMTIGLSILGFSHELITISLIITAIIALINWYRKDMP